MADIKKIFVSDGDEWREIRRVYDAGGNEISIAEAGKRIQERHEARMKLWRVLIGLMVLGALTPAILRML